VEFTKIIFQARLVADFNQVTDATAPPTDSDPTALFFR